MDSQSLDEGRCNLAAEALRTWGVLKLRARGLSMLPTLWPGDVLTVCSRSADQVEPGEIVLYMRHELFFIHRVLSKMVTADGVFLIARGDCMPAADQRVRNAELLGKITEAQRGNRLFVPRKLSLFRGMVGYMLCHWSFFRRMALQFWGRQGGGLPKVFAQSAS